MTPAERHIVVGAAQTGKTVTGKAIVAALLDRRRRAGDPARLVVFDPVEGRPDCEWRPRGAALCRDRQAFLAALRARRYPILVKAAFKDWRPLERLPGHVVAVDEAHEYARPRQIDPSFAILCRQGSHRAIDLVVLSQRPSDLDGAIWANPSKVWIHPLTYGPDRDAVERGLGVSLRGRKWYSVLVGGRPHPTAKRPIVWPDDFRL